MKYNQDALQGEDGQDCRVKTGLIKMLKTNSSEIFFFFFFFFFFFLWNCFVSDLRTYFSNITLSTDMSVFTDIGIIYLRHLKDHTVFSR